MIWEGWVLEVRGGTAGKKWLNKKQPEHSAGIESFSEATLFMEHFILDSYCHILVIRLHLLVGCRNDFPWEMQAIPFSKDALFSRRRERSM